MQLFVEFDKNLKVPTIDKLLLKMFREMKISFAEVTHTHCSLQLSHLLLSAGAIKTPGPGSKIWETVSDIQEDNPWD